LLKIKNHIILLCAILFCLAACKKKKSNLPNLNESFLYNDTNPFGASVAYDILQNSFSTEKIILNKKDIGENYDWAYENNAVYFSVSKNFYPEERDITALLDFAYKGNTAFISANHFDEDFLGKLFCTNNPTEAGFIQYPYQDTKTIIIPELSLYADSASYFYNPFTNYFSSIHSKYARKVGVNNDGKTNMFVFYWGKGRIYVHCEPRAFSNYFLLTKDNHLYMKQIAQMLPTKEMGSTQKIFWDNVYSKRNYPKSKKNDSSSTLSEIFKHPPLKAAFWILFSMLLLYILFGIKRKQREIPVVKPIENNSIAFAEAIAGLYLNKKDNKVIADKIITYFNEQIRTKYFLNIQIQDNSYADVLSRKAAVPIELTKQIAETIKTINKNTIITDTQLLALNGLMERFNKKQNSIPQNSIPQDNNKNYKI
jgi:hypothetical protein